MATTPLIRQLLEAGVHFGHQTKRWNPKMRRYIFGARSGIYIINLEHTATTLTRATDFLRDLAARGGRVLFVGTKKQAQTIVREEAQRCDMFYVVNRWLGGTLTNFQTIRKSVARYQEICRLEEKGIMAQLAKQEIARLTKEKERLVRVLGGVVHMERLPAAVFVISIGRCVTSGAAPAVVISVAKPWSRMKRSITTGSVSAFNVGRYMRCAPVVVSG